MVGKNIRNSTVLIIISTGHTVLCLICIKPNFIGSPSPSTSLCQQLLHLLLLLIANSQWKLMTSGCFVTSHQCQLEGRMRSRINFKRMLTDNQKKFNSFCCFRSLLAVWVLWVESSLGWRTEIGRQKKRERVPFIPSSVWQQRTADALWLDSLVEWIFEPKYSLRDSRSSIPLRHSTLFTCFINRISS